MTTQASNDPNIPTWTLQDGLRKARLFAGLDQAELAERMGVSRATVSGYELGTKKPQRATIIAWSWATGVDVVWFDTLPRLDSNQQPAVYVPALVRALPVRHLRLVS